MIRTLNATRYVTPLREGGSLPAIVEADDGAQYVMKFVGAGQGRKALIAEVIAGEIARALGLRVPEIVFLQLDPAMAMTEPDPEISDLLDASVGLNLGMRYLSEAFAYSPLLRQQPAPDLASTIVWFDAFVTNVDRTARNTNLLVWQKELWLIDHGASLYFHHDWNDYLTRSRTPFALIKDHVLLRFANGIAQVDEIARSFLTPTLIEEIVARVPDVWLAGEEGFANVNEHRNAYVAYLTSRLQAAPIFVQEATNARTKLV